MKFGNFKLNRNKLQILNASQTFICKKISNFDQNLNLKLNSNKTNLIYGADIKYNIQV